MLQRARILLNKSIIECSCKFTKSIEPLKNIGNYNYKTVELYKIIKIKDWFVIKTN